MDLISTDANIAHDYYNYANQEAIINISMKVFVILGSTILTSRPSTHTYTHIASIFVF